MRINNETRRIRKVAALCLHKMLATFRILCDDCHDDELRKERRVRVEGERRHDCHRKEIVENENHIERWFL